MRWMREKVAKIRKFEIRNREYYWFVEGNQRALNKSRTKTWKSWGFPEQIRGKRKGHRTCR
jgi:hypothetical protein